METKMETHKLSQIQIIVIGDHLHKGHKLATARCSKCRKRNSASTISYAGETPDDTHSDSVYYAVAYAAMLLSKRECK